MEHALGQHEERRQTAFQQLSGLWEVALSQLLCEANDWPKEALTRM